MNFTWDSVRLGRFWMEIHTWYFPNALKNSRTLLAALYGQFGFCQCFFSEDSTSLLNIRFAYWVDQPNLLRAYFWFQSSIILGELVLHFLFTIFQKIYIYIWLEMIHGYAYKLYQSEFFHHPYPTLLCPKCKVSSAALWPFTSVIV